jgi:hypothetical protein
MKRFWILASCVVATAALFHPTPAYATIYSVTLTNETDKCAWITTYYSDWANPEWNKSPSVAPQALQARQTVLLVVHASQEMKLRAEVKKAGCSGDNAPGGDTYDVRKDKSNNSIKYTASIHDLKGRYQLWFK